jgi:uncharacterized membrane protein
MTQFRIVFVALAIAWVILLPAAPFAASRSGSASSPASRVLVFAIYGIGRLICHQRPERSFHLFGVQLPVCARCTGIYAGAALMALVAWRSSAAQQTNSRHLPAGAARRLLLVGIAPTAATLLYEWTTGQTPGQWTRAVSGVPLGAAVAWIVCRAGPAEAKVM